MDELLDAVADVRAQPERILRVAAALYEGRKHYKQRDLVARSGYTREHVRRLIEDERIRRGEIPPTARYLREQARREAAEAEQS